MRKPVSWFDEISIITTPQNAISTLKKILRTTEFEKHLSGNYNLFIGMYQYRSIAKYYDICHFLSEVI